MSASTRTATAALGGGRRLVLSPATVLAALVGVLSVAQVSANSGSLLTLGKTETIFAFGDSYTMTNYDPSLGYSPLSQNLTTSTGGNSWLGYLTQSPLALPTLANNTFNFARGGATIAPNATFTGYPNMSMSNQVDIFEKWFTDNSEAFAADQEENGGRPQWDADETLFTVWFGINDIEVAYKRNESWLDVYGNSTFEFLDEQVGRLYTLGARHFLFHLVPPYQLSPLVTNLTRSDPDAYNTFKDDVTLWNDLMRTYVGRLHEIYEGVSAMAWETEEWFEVVLSAPAMFGFTNSTDFCDSYVPNLFLENASPTSPNATNLSSCGVPEAEYFWLDKSHPTFSVHELLATAVATTLSPGERVVVPVSSTTAGMDESTATAATEAVAPTLPDAIVPLVSSDDSASPSSPTLDSTALPPSSSSLIDPSIPTPPIIPIDPNAGVGYTTLPNGDTLPTGTVWTKRGLVKRAPGQAEMQAAREEAARQAAAKKAAKSASSSVAGGSVSSHKERPLWRTRTAPVGGGSTVSVRPLPSGVPLDPNVGMGYKTLPNGDTIPTGKVWTRRRKRSLGGVEEEARNHLEKKAHDIGGGGKKGGMRKITPTMVNQEVAKRAQAQQAGEGGGGGGIWEGVKERMRESVLHPAGLGVAV